MEAKIPLKIVGTGPLTELYENHSFDKIEFLGYKKEKELWDIVSNASFVVVPSEWYENNPLTIIEAYSFGKPVISTEGGGVNELITDSETGFIIEPKNPDELVAKINLLLNNPALLKSIGKNAKERVQTNFSLNKMTDNYIALYKKYVDTV